MATLLKLRQAAASILTLKAEHAEKLRNDRTTNNRSGQ